ncbi:MAG: hypothetical protein HY744_17030 [Deltaproteobacteria bacterium]|nr:hypothetical protein [Deltaproteobacteria bacterium]
MERDGVMAARVLELSGADRPIEVPVGEAFLPNAYVGVAAVPRDAQGALPAAGYPFRAGYVEVPVSPEARRLHVQIEPARAGQRPGEQATVKIRVRRSNGRPARAEVTLWAADEGVLMLTGYRTPDPFVPVYARHNLTVSSSLNLSRSLDDENDWDDGGGDAGLLGSALRSRLLFTAFFSEGVVTNEAGEATLRFKLPDNLTRWRIMAVAADQGQRFGRAEAAIRTSKPLQVTPSLPRFLTAGDLVDAGAVVHNQTGADVEAEIRLVASGAEVVGALSQKLRVPAGAQQAVRFPVVARQAGSATFRAAVRGGGESDGFELALPVHRASVTQSEMLGEGRLDPRAQAEVAVPPGALPGSPELLITVSPTLLASLEAGIDALFEYPYGCAEQKTSRLVPMAVLGDLIRDLGLAELDQGEHRRRLQATIAELERHHNEDGGFGLWPGSESDGFVTAYVLFGWLVAQEHGYLVPADRLDRAMEYLQERIRQNELGPGYFGFDARVLAAYVLARGRRPDHGLADRLRQGRAELTRFEQGLLAAVLVARDPARAQAVLGELGQARQSDAGGGARIVERQLAGSGYFDFGRDLRATAAAAAALVAAGRRTEAEPLVAGILRERGGDGTWGTTYNNLWAVYALGAYAAGDGKKWAGAGVKLSLGGKQLGDIVLGARASARRLLLPATSLPAPGEAIPLLLGGPAGAGLRYSVRLRFAATPQAQPPVAKGYRIERALLDAETGSAVARPRVGQLVRVRLLLRSDEDRHQVALTDRLPAGLEAVDARLQTEQQIPGSDPNWRWDGREVRDERVSFFAHDLGAGAHAAEYLARASRSGEFVWPAATAESMYDPRAYGRGAIEQIVVVR